MIASSFFLLPRPSGAMCAENSARPYAFEALKTFTANEAHTYSGQHYACSMGSLCMIATSNAMSDMQMAFPVCKFCCSGKSTLSSKHSSSDHQNLA